MASQQPPKKSLKDLAKENPSMLGDPVSLKAETSTTEPTEHDRGAASASPNTSSSPTNNSSSTTTTNNNSTESSNSHKSLKQLAQEKLSSSNPTMLGDPVSLKAETSETEPTPDDRGAAGTVSTGKERTGKEGGKGGKKGHGAPKI
ncbi:hypothetical protein LTR28_006675 [Elasticomyces elasticus]|nr:hypothetical protein LTR28_006675 [Elasticomyces elasticus]